MEMQIKHVFANAMCCGKETNYDINNAFDMNGCPIKYNIATSWDCNNECRECFERHVKDTRRER